MKKSLRLMGVLLLGGVSFGALTVQAHADEPAGWYVGANGGLNWNDSLKTDLAPTSTGDRFRGAATNSSTVNFDNPGFAGHAAVGYNWGNNIRTEVEGGYAQTQVNRVRGIGSTGRSDVWTGFVNAYYDFDLTQINVALPIVPYLGVGVGAADWTQEKTRPEGTGAGPGISGNDVAFAYQAIAGVAYNIDDNWAATIEGRYMDTPAADFGDNKPLYVTNHLHSYEALAGIRYTFSEPKTASKQPMPASAKAVASSSYLVFFDFNKYNLTTDATKIVDNAAAAAKGNSGVTRLDVTGHTDTVGSDAYNMKLSKRRAESVKAELVKQGIPASEIVVYAKGKRDPLVPTGDGVREPQNRRVEIVFH
jgi:outer membrane protein OmpA-like peptidoglycan-associated protein